MKFWITTTLPHGITPQDTTGPWTPANATVTFKDFSTAELAVTGVQGEKKVELEFGTTGYRPEDVISVDERYECPESGSGSASASSSS